MTAFLSIQYSDFMSLMGGGAVHVDIVGIEKTLYS